MSDIIAPLIKTYGALDYGSTDHKPIFVKLERQSEKPKPKPKFITKRCTKSINVSDWCTKLMQQPWERLGESYDANFQASIFSTNILTVLNEVAPLKRIKIHHNYCPHLSKETKELLRKRDNTRGKLSKKIGDPIKLKRLHNKFKKLRNLCTSRIRSDQRASVATKILGSHKKSDVWKIVDKIIKPKTRNEITLREQGTKISNENEIAHIFNQYFINKIEDLRSSIDQNNRTDPLQYLREISDQRSLPRFTLKTVSESMVNKAIKSLKNKDSFGLDELSTRLLKAAASVLTIPITRIINTSITTGIFPAAWKEAKIVPLHKKGDLTDKQNYRPISILPCVSKVLESVVNRQLIEHLEHHKILPKSQHGFRTGRSTTSALIDMHSAWLSAYEKKHNTGVLLWDLSAAFDLLDSDLFIQKLAAYNFDARSRSWFRSFLSERTQRVQIGQALSPPIPIKMGCPQGAILSPTCFILFCADMPLWLNEISTFSYADDTVTSFSHPDPQIVMNTLQTQAFNMLRYMSSNMLVVNPSKTTFLFMRASKKNSSPITITIDNNQIEDTPHARVLGLQVDNDMGWEGHIFGKGGLISTLTSSLFLLRRISRHVSHDLIKPIVDGIFISHIRYGLQLFGRVRMENSDKKTQCMKSIQTLLNKAARFMLNIKLSDHVSTDELMSKAGFLSVNQMAAESKLLEVWKQLNEKPGCLKELFSYSTSYKETRSTTRNDLTWSETTMRATLGFVPSSSKIWNDAPLILREAKSRNAARTIIKKYAQSLPV